MLGSRRLLSILAFAERGAVGSASRRTGFRRAFSRPSPSQARCGEGAGTGGITISTRSREILRSLATPAPVPDPRGYRRPPIRSRLH